MELLTKSQVDNILKSFERVFKTNNIEKLTKNAYNFIMLSSGFIAHYNIYGFRDYYSDVNNFSVEIVNCHNANRWENFRVGDKDYDYYRQKAEIYEQVVKMAEKYLSIY